MRQDTCDSCKHAFPTDDLLVIRQDHQIHVVCDVCVLFHPRDEGTEPEPYEDLLARHNALGHLARRT